MPITYSVHSNGTFIYAIASGIVSKDEFVKYEIDHANDPRVKTPLRELLEIKYGACAALSKEDFDKVLEERKKIKNLPTPHKCAIILSYSDVKGWNLAKFYEGMVNLHYPESVIVFGDMHIASVWLGVENIMKELKK
ncbi:MAG: hypothetical protein ABII88_06745 [Candidatus Omnitrophota bacterium]